MRLWVVTREPALGFHDVAVFLAAGAALRGGTGDRGRRRPRRRSLKRREAPPRGGASSCRRFAAPASPQVAGRFWMVPVACDGLIVAFTGPDSRSVKLSLDSSRPSVQVGTATVRVSEVVLAAKVMWPSLET